MAKESRNILLEIGTEELPTTYIQPALDQMRTWAEEWAPRSSITTWGTPRRLLLFIENIPQTTKETVYGPPLKKAKYENGEWNRSAIGFAHSRNKTIEDLEIGHKNGKEYLKLEIYRDSCRRLCDEVLILLNSIKFPKTMRWLPSDPFRFARPIRRLVFLWGEDVIDLKVAGIESGRYTRGHRFFGDKQIKLISADLENYRKVLKDQYVIVNQAERREQITFDILEQQRKYRPSIKETDLDGGLLEEVCNLVEYPRIIVGDFADSYLGLPSAVLITVMKSHQRYFPVFDSSGQLLPKFIIIANGPFQDSGDIKSNNERVLRARLADARFFWEEDIRRSLEDRVTDLEGIVFHRRLGTYRDKIGRLKDLVHFIADQLELTEDQIKKIKRMTLLCKSDLTASLVKEFTELQGVMGREYALKSGEDPDVAQGIYEHYLPISAGGDLPESMGGQILALADKLDSVAGFLSAGINPSGSQDPYGLKRQAQGVIRLLAEKGLPLRFDSMVARTVAGYHLDKETEEEVKRKVLEFFRLRLEAYLDSRGVSRQVIDSILSSGWNDFQDVSLRIKVIQNLEGAKILLAAATIVERTHNIIRAENLTGEEGVREELLIEPAERNLFQALRLSPEIEKLIDEKEYRKATEEYVRVFSRPLSRFFDEVMVNVEDKDRKRNRMILLTRINRLYAKKVADLSLLQFERGEHVL